ncbi:unnamed protein product [Symbiodinium sp. CCMP2592]|nr:unnamed protein product [Symbiodinium sp. CCMP2592]
MDKDAAASGRPAKLQKLHDLRRGVPYVSKSALEGILKTIQEKGIPEVVHTKAMLEATRKEISSWNAYGSLLQTCRVIDVHGAEKDLMFVNFHSFLHGLFKQGDAWMCLMFQKTNFIGKLDGSMSQEHVFCNDVVNPQLTGVLLQSPDPEDPPLRLYYRFRILVQDGAAQKFCLAMKGDSDTKFCVKCKNCICIKSSRQCDNDSDAEEDFSTAKYTKKSQLHLASDSEVLDSWQRMEQRFLSETPKVFAQWEQATGFSFSREALLGSTRLRPFLEPVSCYMHDWMHGVVANGALNIVGYLFLQAMQEQGLQSWSSFRDYLGFWVLPAATKKACPDLPSLFDSKRVDACKKSSKLKMQASELLCIGPILSHFASTACAGAADQRPCKALVAMVFFLELLTSVVHGCVRGKELGKAAERVLQLVVENDWEAWMVKKFHWMLHYGDSLQLHNCLIPCFAMERKHKQLTKIGTPIKNMRAYERAVLEEVVSGQLFKLKQPGRFDMSCRLLSQSCKATRAMQELLAQHGVTMGQVTICRTLKLAGGGSVSTGDVVLLKMQSALACGILLANFGNGQPHSILKFLDFQKTLADAAEWKEAHDNQAHVVSSFGILCAVSYFKSSDVYRTLLPYHARNLLARGS